MQNQDLPPGFDPVFYLATHIDVRDSGMDAAAHYRQYGHGERRYFCQEQLDEDLATVRAARDFDEVFYQAKVGTPVEDPILDYLLRGRAPPNKDFEWSFIMLYYGKTLGSYEHPYVFYCKHLGKPWCKPNLSKIAPDCDTLRASGFFDEGFYGRSAGLPAVVDPAGHYLVEGFRAMASPSRRFDSAAYAAEYSDLLLVELNPLLHWVQSGRYEHRRTIGIDDVVVRKGGVARDPARETVLIVSHEASRTGAPVVVLSLARHLSQRFNVVVLSHRGGPLATEFQRFSIGYVELGGGLGDVEAAVARIVEQFSPSVAILNSIIPAYDVRCYATHGLGVVTLVHDFATYVRPTDRVAKVLALSDEVVFPATIVRDAALDALADRGEAAALTNLHVRPQGRSMLPPHVAVTQTPRGLDKIRALRRSGKRIVIGAGHVQPRKGVDLFIETARMALDDPSAELHFLWVGAGYDPVTDAGLSVFLKDQIVKSGLRDHVTFVAEVADFDAVLALGDAFLLSSRLDPFPNVALDAAAKRLPVVCFQGATGIADMAEPFPTLFQAVPYHDCAAAALALRDAIEADADRLDREHAAYMQASDFANYADYIADLVGSARAKEMARRKLVETWMRDEHFDWLAFHRSAPAWLRQPAIGVAATRREAAALAARFAQNGYDRALLRPGTITAAGDEPATFETVPLAAAPEAAAPLQRVAVVQSLADVQQVANALYASLTDRGLLLLIDADDPVTSDQLATVAASMRNVELMDARRWSSLRPGTLVKLWHVAGDAAAPEAVTRYDAAASGLLESRDDLDAVFLQTETASAAPIMQDDAPPPSRIGGLATSIVDQHHFWFRVPPAGLATKLGDALLTASIRPGARVASLIDALSLAAKPPVVIERRSRWRQAIGEITFGRVLDDENTDRA